MIPDLHLTWLIQVHLGPSDFSSFDGQITTVRW